MKKRIFFYFMFFLLAISAAFASAAKKSSATYQSYKVSNEPGQPCHKQTGTVDECGGTTGLCQITLAGVTRTYYEDDACVTILKKP